VCYHDDKMFSQPQKILLGICLLGLGFLLGTLLRWPTPLISKPDNFVRVYPPIIKATFDPGSDIFNKLLNENYTRAQRVGFNTVYIYVNHDYDQGTLKLVSPIGGPHFSSTAQAEYEELIRAAKQKGYAVLLALQFAMPNSNPLGVPQEQFLRDAEAAAQQWAAIAEQYQVEFFAPGSEIDVPLRYEYFGGNGNRDDEVFALTNAYHQVVLPAITQVFQGKTVYQHSYSARGEVEAAGYDLIGIDFNHANLPLAQFPAYVRKVYAQAAQAAKTSQTDWYVAEYWANFRGKGQGPQPGEVLKNQAGQSLDELQDDYLHIATTEYLKFTGDPAPQGFGVMSYQHPLAQIIDRPAEKVLTEFFRQL